MFDDDEWRGTSLPTLERLPPLSPEEESLLDTLTEEEVFFVLENGEDFKAVLKYDSFQKAKRKFVVRDPVSLRVAKNLFDKKATLLSIAQKRTINVKPSSHKIGETLLDLSSPASYLFLLIDASFTLVTGIAVATFVAIGGVFAALVAVIGLIHFIGMYKELKQRDKKIDRCYQLLALQNECIDTYLKKQNQPVDLDIEIENQSDAKPDKKRWQKTKDAIGSGIIVSSTLFYSYYAVTLALTVAFAGFAFVSVMTGPIGIGVALGIALVAGISIAYLKYRQDSKNQILKENRKEMERQFNAKYDKYQTLRLSAHNKKNENIEELSPPSQPLFKSVTKAISPKESRKIAAFPIGTWINHDTKNSYQNTERYRWFTKEKKVITTGLPLSPEDAPAPSRYPTIKRSNSSYF